MTKKGLASHMNKHTDNLRYRCIICEKGFDRPSGLKRHMRQRHSKSEDQDQERDNLHRLILKDNQDLHSFILKDSQDQDQEKTIFTVSI